MTTSTSGASRRGEEPPEQRQTGLCSMQRPVILLSGLPPDLPDGFIRRAYRPSDRPALPTALPEALAGKVTWVILTAHLTDGFRQPDFPTSRPPDLPDGFIRRAYRPSDRPALPTALPEALAGRVTWVILTGWFYTPDLPAGFVPAARPASLTSSPTGSLTSGQTGQPHQ